MSVFLFGFLMQQNILMDFQILTLTYNWNKPYLIMMWNFLHMWLNFICQNFKYFCFYIFESYWSVGAFVVFLFDLLVGLVLSLPTFGIGTSCLYKMS